MEVCKIGLNIWIGNFESVGNGILLVGGRCVCIGGGIEYYLGGISFDLGGW